MKTSMMYKLIGSSCILFAAAFSGVPARAAMAPNTPACPAPGVATPASYTWDFKAEANQLLQNVRTDAQAIATSADYLQSYARGSMVSWQTDQVNLIATKDIVSDMDGKVCRLEAIRRVVAPEQQQAIDKVLTEERLIALHTNDAYNFGQNHYESMWSPVYQNDLINLYNEAQAVTLSVDRMERVS